MKALKVYGVNGLMEWHCQIIAGGATFHFEFVDGVLTAHGSTPAKFKTDNILFQNIIENSNYFKNGRIKLLKTVVLEADEPKDEVKKIKVSCLEDAKQILCDEYGADALSLTGKRSIVNAAKERKIRLLGIGINACMKDSVASMRGFLRTEGMEEMALGLSTGDTLQVVPTPIGNKI